MATGERAGGGEIIISDFPFLLYGDVMAGGVLIISGSDHSAGQSGLRPRNEAHDRENKGLALGRSMGRRDGSPLRGSYACTPHWRNADVTPGGASYLAHFP